MYITDTHTVTLDEAAYEVTKALLPFLIEAWRKLADAVMTYTYVSGKSGYTTTITVPELGTWWVSIEPCH